MEKKAGKKTNEKPISLFPLTQEEALRKFLAVPPPKRKKKKKPTRP